MAVDSGQFPSDEFASCVESCQGASKRFQVALHASFQLQGQGTVVIPTVV